VALAALSESVRIQAASAVVVKPDDRSVFDVMHETNRDADVVFAGLMLPEPGQEDDYAARLEEMVAPLPTTVLVLNSGPFRGRLLT